MKVKLNTTHGDVYIQVEDDHPAIAVRSLETALAGLKSSGFLPVEYDMDAVGDLLEDLDVEERTDEWYMGNPVPLQVVEENGRLFVCNSVRSGRVYHTVHSHAVGDLSVMEGDISIGFWAVDGTRLVYDPRRDGPA